LLLRVTVALQLRILVTECAKGQIMQERTRFNPSKPTIYPILGKLRLTRDVPVLTYRAQSQFPLILGQCAISQSISKYLINSSKMQYACMQCFSWMQIVKSLIVGNVCTVRVYCLI
jgi:hypothetical protein